MDIAVTGVKADRRFGLLMRESKGWSSVGVAVLVGLCIARVHGFCNGKTIEGRIISAPSSISSCFSAAFPYSGKK